MGEPGTGKTRLAATFPDPFFLDLEPDGATTALPGGVNRIEIPTDSSTLSNVRKAIQSLANSKFEDGRLLYQTSAGEISVGTLVIDSIDALQRAVASFEILKGRTKMEMQDWGVLLEKMSPLVLEWSALSIGVVVVSHVKIKESDDKADKVRDAVLAVRGALKDEMPRWFSHILHIVSGPDAKRVVITQPLIRRGFRYLAKDRHNSLAGISDQRGVVSLPAEDGYPSSEIADIICGVSDGRPE